MTDRQRPRSEQRQRQVMLAARFGPEEERRIRDAAKAQRISVAGFIRKAVLAAAEALPSPEEGAVTEWALAYTHRPTGLPGLPFRRIVQPYPDEQSARGAVADLKELAPEDEPGLVCREVGPWTPVPGEEGTHG